MIALYFFGALCVIGIIGIIVTLVYKHKIEHK
jgi:hypothetical protein